MNAHEINSLQDIDTCLFFTFAGKPTAPLPSKATIEE